MTHLYVDYVWDYETVGPSPNGKIVELSYVPFIDDPHNPPTFEELVSPPVKSINLICVSNQIALQTNQRSDWWKQQSEEARVILKPSPDDIDLYEGHKQFFEDLKADGVSRWQSLDYVRGPEFDRGILVDVVRKMTGKVDIFDDMPTVFWNSRDVRTAIENRLLTRGASTCPLRKGILNGFVMHNSIHDCAKDALMLIYAMRYAMGLEEPPTEEETDELSFPRKR
ncbi:DexA exonuclease A [Escherichia phage RB43]|uniref:DexA exonuclease A n=1 Tax=Escherichia phage RB43 TaxID=2887182 RepID=Q56C27_9CAUD|nr:DexA exonuclease A [Escherichia phage RB43]AAX78543.1 DexA exonuclease A [Escherichia phage RB43]